MIDSPNKDSVLLEEIRKGPCNDGKVTDKFAIITSEPEEAAKFLGIGRRRP